MYERLVLCFILSLGWTACKSDDVETDVSAMTAAPAVALSDLVAAERNDASPLEEPHRIALSQTELELEGKRFMELEKKQFAPRVGSDPGVPQLAQRLRSTPGKTGALLRVHANASWGALSRVLATLAAEGVSPVHFEVRKDLSGNIGHLPLGAFEIDAEDASPKPFEGELQKEWDRVVGLWEEMSEQCVGRGAVHCSNRPDEVLEGGLAEMELFAQQDALRLRFLRFSPGAVEATPEEAPEPDGEEGDAEAASGPAGEIEFMWRRAAAHVNGSPIARTVKSLCGSEPCGAVIRSHEQAAAGSVLRLLASVYPNGAPAPVVRVVVPPGA